LVRISPTAVLASMESRWCRHSHNDEDSDSEVEEILTRRPTNQYRHSRQQQLQLHSRSPSQKPERDDRGKMGVPQETSPRDRAVLQTIEKSAESVARGFAKIVEKGQGMAIGLTNHGTELRMRPENVCFACRSFIGTDIHYRELNSTYFLWM